MRGGGVEYEIEYKEVKASEEVTARKRQGSEHQTEESKQERNEKR